MEEGPCTVRCLGCDADLGEEPLRDLCDLCHREWCADMEADARVKDAAHDLLAALKRGLEPNALTCSFAPQADDDHACCCGRPRAYHWKAQARDVIARAEGNGA